MPSGVWRIRLLSVHCSLFTVHAPVITCYRRESNPKLSIKSVCCVISPCICPVFTGGLGEEYTIFEETKGECSQMVTLWEMGNGKWEMGNGKMGNGKWNY